MPKGIRITSQKEGFRRAGIAHSKEAAIYPADQFSKERLAALMAEPMLMVTEVDMPDPESEVEPKTNDKKSAKKAKK